MQLDTIHRMSPSDWQRVRAIRLRALAESPDAFASTLEKERLFSDAEWMKRLQGEDVATFVASSNSAIDIGLATSAPYEQFAGIYSMWVAPESRGNGVGGALIKAVIEWAIQQRQSQLLLDVGDYNTAAIALYESKGFRPTGVVDTLPPPRTHITEHQRALLLGPNTN